MKMAMVNLGLNGLPFFMFYNYIIAKHFLFSSYKYQTYFFFFKLKKLLSKPFQFWLNTKFIGMRSTDLIMIPVT